MKYLKEVSDYIKLINKKLNFNELINHYDYNIKMINDFLLCVEKKLTNKQAADYLWNNYYSRDDDKNKFFETMFFIKHTTTWEINKKCQTNLITFTYINFVDDFLKLYYTIQEEKISMDTYSSRMFCSPLLFEEDLQKFHIAFGLYGTPTWNCNEALYEFQMRLDKLNFKYKELINKEKLIKDFIEKYIQYEMYK